MTIEATLSSIDATLKSLLFIQQTGAAAQHTFGTPKAASEVAKAAKSANTSRNVKETPVAVDTTLELPGVPSTTADVLGLVDGDPTGTRYWLIEAHNTVYAQKPGEPDPQIASAKITNAKDYSEKMAEYAKKSLVPPVTATPVASIAASAPTASPAEATRSFDDVIKLLKQIAQGAESDGLGRPALVTVLDKYLPADAKVRNVPALAAVNRNAEIYTDANLLLNPVAAEEADIFG